MSALPIDPRSYGKLLTEALPTVVHTQEQNERYINMLYELDRKEALSVEEAELAGLLRLLITQFEEKHYKLKRTSPRGVLRFLMEQHDLKQKDLRDVFGTESAVSQFLSGKRELSKEQIRRLAKRFHVSPELFF